MKARQDFATEQEWLEYYRHYAAAMALQGCIASGFETSMEKQAESAVEAADHLITQLNKPTTNG